MRKFEEDSGSESDDLSANDSNEENSDGNIGISGSDCEDSDSSPEELGFKDGEKQAKLFRKQAWQEFQTTKYNLKRKRTEMHERNAKQKEGKKVTLASSSRELASDVLLNLGNKTTKPSPISDDISTDEKMDLNTSEKTENPELNFESRSSVFKVKNLKKLRGTFEPAPEIQNFRNSHLLGRKNLREKCTTDYFKRIAKQKSGGKQ